MTAAKSTVCNCTFPWFWRKSCIRVYFQTQMCYPIVLRTLVFSSQTKHDYFKCLIHYICISMCVSVCAQVCLCVVYLSMGVCFAYMCVLLHLDKCFFGDESKDSFLLWCVFEAPLKAHNGSVLSDSEAWVTLQGYRSMTSSSLWAVIQG
jgi:hypothetical protein